MENKVNYTLVGVFVLALSAALIGTLLWLTVGTEEKQYDIYRLFFRDSVAGLNPKAAVRLRGVAVGEVASIALDRKQPDRVIVDLKIERGTPILESTKAVLATQGLTGIAAIELSVDNPNAPALKRREDEPFPVIPTGPSLVQRLDNAVTQVLGDFGKLSNRLQALLDQDNLDAVHDTLGNLRTLSAALAKQTATLDQVLSATADTAEAASGAAKEIRTLGARLKTTVGLVDDTVRSFGQTARTLDTAVAGTRRDLQQFAGSAGPELAGLLAELRRMTEVVERLGGELERNPRMLLFGRKNDHPGPGE